MQGRGYGEEAWGLLYLNKDNVLINGNVVTNLSLLFEDSMKLWNARKLKLTVIRASITCLQVWRLVPLVTSKNNSLVVFFICETQSCHFMIILFKHTQPVTIMVCVSQNTAQLISNKTHSNLSPLGKQRIHTLVFSLLVIGGNEITCPSASTRHG